MPTPLNFFSLSLFLCICFFCSSHARSSLYLLNSIVRSFLCNTTFLSSVSPCLTVCQLRTSSSFPHSDANPWTIPRNIIPFSKRFGHHLPLPCSSLHLLWWLATLLLLSRVVFTPPLHWAPTDHVLMVAIATGTNKSCTRHFTHHMPFLNCALYILQFWVHLHAGLAWKVPSPTKTQKPKEFATDISVSSSPLIPCNILHTSGITMLKAMGGGCTWKIWSVWEQPTQLKHERLPSHAERHLSNGW